MMENEGHDPLLRRCSRVGLAIIFLLALTPSRAEAQHGIPADSAQAQIGRTLRAFYFNLAHGDWEAVTADILAAKVVAHRPPPGALAALNAEVKACRVEKGPQVDRSTIVLAGAWARALVPRCGLPLNLSAER